MAKGPRISDHAMLRLLERAGGFDVEGLRTAMSDALERGHTAAREISSADYLVTIDGMTFVVRGETVTTVMETGNPARQAKVLRRR